MSQVQRDERQEEAVRKVWAIVTGILTDAHGEETIGDVQSEAELLLGFQCAPTLATVCDALAVGVEIGIVPAASVSMAHDLVESVGQQRVSTRLCGALGLKVDDTPDTSDNDTVLFTETTQELDTSDNDVVGIVPMEPVCEADTLDTSDEVEDPQAVPVEATRAVADNAPMEQPLSRALELTGRGKGEAAMDKSKGKSKGESKSKGKGNSDISMQDSLPRCLLFSKPSPQLAPEKPKAEKFDNLDFNSAFPVLITDEEKQLRAERKARDDALRTERKEKELKVRRKLQEEAERKAGERAREDAERRGREQLERLRRQFPQVEQQNTAPRFAAPAYTGAGSGQVWGVNRFCGNRSCTLCYPSRS